MVNIGNDWDVVLKDVFASEEYLRLREFLKAEYSSRRIYPDMHDIFNALRFTPYDSVKAVILGQDPYHGAGQAHGLAFSVKRGVEIPPSLVNIFKELNSDVGFKIPDNGCLEAWTRQGVLLLNTVLTVRAGEANSHKGHGWEYVTDEIISRLNKREKPMVFMLWGGNAKAKERLITNPSHLILKAAHPSPLSAYSGFFGCRHFSRTNEFLIKNGQTPIDWTLKQ